MTEPQKDVVTELFDSTPPDSECAGDLVYDSFVDDGLLDPTELGETSPNRYTHAYDQQSDTPAEPSPLMAHDLAAFFGAEGPLARHLDTYELRPSQLEMAQAVKRAILSQEHALIDAPTGTGKSIAYLAPAILSGKTIVVATANKSLQNQLFRKDIPFLSKVLGREISAVVVKGRSNFVCTLKWENELVEQRQIALYDWEDEQVRHMRGWLEETETGDVDDLPFMLSSDLRPRVVSFADDCLHSECRHSHDNCWVNFMRDRAAEVQVLITNHHLLLNALELGQSGERILPPAAIYVIDEAHQLEETATAVYETSVSDFTVVQLLSRSVYKEHVDEDVLDELRFQNTLAFQAVANMSRDNSFRIEAELEEVRALAGSLRDVAQRMKDNNPYDGDSPDLNMTDGELSEDGVAVNGNKKNGGPNNNDKDEGEAGKIYELGIEALNSTVNKLLMVSASKRDESYVRYAVRVFDRRHVSIELHAAPINPAGLLSNYLFHPEEDGEALSRTVICTSATLATKGNFEHFKQRCGILESGEELVLPAVFDYPRQALLYQPQLPAYNWRNTDVYYDAAAAEIERLLEVSRGRALCLFTSWSGLQLVNDRLQRMDSAVIWPVRAQGDAPRNALLEWFLETPNSVLLATRSFWEGVDIPGEDLSMVIMDKMPFPTPKDPLHSSRMKAIDDDGRSSFGEYMIPLMTLTLKQGFGRLIRRSSDRGIVAILDERLTSKSYGRQTRQDLPPAPYSRSFKDVHKFFQVALTSKAEFGLNVWSQTLREPVDVNDFSSASAKPERSVGWRWQLLRLQDGRSDRAEGVLENGDLLAGELYAAVLGLRDLCGRIEQAGRSPKQFGVELRCSPPTAEVLLGTGGRFGLLIDWTTERDKWRNVEILPLQREHPTES